MRKINKVKYFVFVNCHLHCYWKSWDCCIIIFHLHLQQKKKRLNLKWFFTSIWISTNLIISFLILLCHCHHQLFVIHSVVEIFRRNGNSFCCCCNTTIEMKMVSFTLNAKIVFAKNFFIIIYLFFFFFVIAFSSLSIWLLFSNNG